LKYFIKTPLLCLLYTIAFATAFAPSAHAVDGCSSTAFKVATNLHIEAGVFGVAVADFNTDGHLDLIVVPNNGFNEVTLLFGRGGTERFGPPINIPVGGPPGRLVAADFNADGKPDLAISMGDARDASVGFLAILLNDGTGKFNAPIRTSLPGGPIQPVAADLNNDGKLDIVTGLSDGTADGKLAIMLGNGSGGFAHAANSPIVTESSTLAVIGDFNEDGKRDVAIPGRLILGGVDLRFGDGAGGFGPVVNISSGSGSSSLIQGDFNNDGHLDLLSGDRMMLGIGTGNFGGPIVVPAPSNNGAALAAHLNNDSNLDLVSAGTTGLTILLGNGTGNLVRGKSFASGFTTFGALSFAAVGDFNEDGKADLAAVQRSGIGILDGDGTGEFNDAWTYRTTIASPRDLVVADFNGDGKQDFAAVSSPFGSPPGVAGIEVMLGDGAGSFTTKAVINFSLSFLTAITAADFNSDGKPDLAVVRPSDARLYILLNDGTGGFPADGLSAPFSFAGFQVSNVKAGDFNNDSKADLITMTGGPIAVHLGNGSGGFSMQNGPSLFGTGTFDLDIGDFNGDGNSDLAIIRTGLDQVTVLKGDGTGNFSDYTIAATPGRPSSIVVKDLSGDGKPDIAVGSSAFESVVRQGYVTVLINNGAQGFHPGTDYPVDAAGAIAAGIFNNDSQPDLAVISGGFEANSSLFSISFLTNKGDGQFNAPSVMGIADQPTDLATGDFNNDGKDDIVLGQFSQSVALLLNNFATSHPCLSVNDVSITENDSGIIDAVFTITLSGASAQPVSVNYFARPFFSLASNVIFATKGVDFDDVPGTVTFAPGETTKTISVPIKGDVIDELDQLFSVNLTTPINAVISNGRGLGTIVDNDQLAALSINDVAVVEGTNNISEITFTVSLSGPSEKPISLLYATTPGTATPSADYAPISGSIAFGPGTTSRTISFPIFGDTGLEPDETFFVNLTDPNNATIADAQGQGTITNDDPQPGITIGASFSAEGAQGTSANGMFELRLSNSSFQTITVNYATADGTASAGSDYVATSGTVTFNPGETTKSVAVSVLGDNIDEINETYVVNLSNASNASIATAQGTGTVVDDDGPTISINNVSVVEGNAGTTNAVFTVTLSAPSVQDVNVNFATVNGTASSGLDYQRIFSSTLFVPAGATSGTITVRVFGDFQIEADEQFIVFLQFPNNASIGEGQSLGIGTIVNDDSNGKLEFSSQAYSTVEGIGNLVVQVNRVDGATGTVTVDYATMDGTAVAGSDYTATSGTLTFNQGDIAKAILIPIANDNVIEAAETFSVKLSNATGNATIPNPQPAVVTIQLATPVLVLEESGPSPTQLAAIDSLLFLRDPFSVLRPFDLYNQGTDRNTRIILFVTNLELAQGEAASSVVVNLVDSSGQTHDVAAEDVRVIPGFDFAQVLFRLPDNLAQGVCNIKLKVHGQESNQGTIRIKP
jgi:hypothetical protein